MSFTNDQVSEKETEKIIESAWSCLDVDGDYVEMGCYKGDTSLLLADVLRETSKRLWIYDSFEGLPENSEEDASALGSEFQKGELYVTKREVKERFLRANLKVPVIKKAWFNELSTEDLPEKIAFAFIDGDFYESIRDAMSGGVILVHDYNNLALPGVKKAVEEFVDADKITVFESLAIIKI